MFKNNNSHFRTTIIKRNIIGSFAVKAISIIISLLLVPLTINYINSEMYGIWLTLTSIISWASFFDIGFGNGLRNKLAMAIALKDYRRGRAYISTTYFYISIIFIAIGVLLYCIIPYINWASFLNVSDSLNEQLCTVVKIVVCFFVIQMILKVLTTVIMANQQNAFASLIDTLGQALSLFFIFVLTKTTFPSLSYLAFALSLAPALVLLIFTVVLFKGKYKQLSPSVKLVNRVYAKDILQLGGYFFIIQIAVLVSYQTTNIILSRISGPESVTAYNVAYKYLGVSMMFFNIVMSPIWSAFTDAYAKLDYEWMNSIYKKLLKILYLCFIALFFMLLISSFVYKLWLGDKVNVSIGMSIVIAIYMAVNMWNSLHSLIINGVGKIRLQLYLSLSATVLQIPLALYLGTLFGSEGVVVAMIVFGILPAIFLSIQTRRILSGNAINIWAK